MLSARWKADRIQRLVRRHVMTTSMDPTCGKRVLAAADHFPRAAGAADACAAVLRGCWVKDGDATLF